MDQLGAAVTQTSRQEVAAIRHSKDVHVTLKYERIHFLERNIFLIIEVYYFPTHARSLPCLTPRRDVGVSPYQAGQFFSVARSRNFFRPVYQKSSFNFGKSSANWTKTSIEHTHEGKIEMKKFFCVSGSVSVPVLLNKELLQKIFSDPFPATFGKIRPQILPANFISLRPLLSFLAEISATWQHCNF
jgi:hypothetical protein